MIFKRANLRPLESGVVNQEKTKIYTTSYHQHFDGRLSWDSQFEAAGTKDGWTGPRPFGESG